MPTKNPKPLYLSCAIACTLSQMSYANTHDSANKPVVLDPLVVRFVVPTNVEVIGQNNLKQTAAQNIDDLTLYEPGVDVGSDNMRLGHQNFSIRGINSNRILMTVDGIPLPDEQKDIARNGLTPIVSRDTIEADTIKQVRIVKGGNGTVQGDGAIGGAINMQTYHPLDLVNDDKPWHTGLKYSYRSAYRSHGVTASAALKQDIFSALAMVTQRKLHEAKNYPADTTQIGSNRTESNHQDTQQNNLLLKFHINGDNHHLETSAERFTRTIDTNLFSQQGPSRSRTGTLVQQPIANANDRYKRQRFGINYRYTPQTTLINALSIKAYHQKFNSYDNEYLQSLSVTPPSTSNPNAGSNAGRPNAPQAGMGSGTTHANQPNSSQGNASSGTHIQSINKHNTYEQKIQGIRPELSATWQTGSIQHNMLFGGEYRHTKTARLQFQDIDDNRAGKRQNTSAYFPPADRRVVSLYAQNNMNFENGATVGLGLRFEQEKSTFDFDHPSYLASTRGNPVKFDAASNRVLLPSLGLSYPLTNNLTGSFAYRRGYRSPDVNFTGAGYDSGRGYRVIPNPKLKPESSDNYEIGLRFGHDKINASITSFYHQYRDFIASTTVHDVAPPTGYTSQFRYDNVDKARTYGVEAKIDYRLTDQLRASGALAWIDAKNQQTNEPLSTSYPFNGVLGLDYVQDNWDIGAKVRFAAKNTKVPNNISSPQTPYFQAPGYGVIDVTGGYRVNDNLALTAGIYNLTNKKFWTAADTVGVLDNAQKERHTQPARNFAIGAEVKF